MASKRRAMRACSSLRSSARKPRLSNRQGRGFPLFAHANLERGGRRRERPRARWMRWPSRGAEPRSRAWVAEGKFGVESRPSPFCRFSVQRGPYRRIRGRQLGQTPGSGLGNKASYPDQQGTRPEAEMSAMAARASARKRAAE